MSRIFGRSDRVSLSDQLENLGLIIALAEEAQMPAGDSPFAVDQKRRRERIDATIELRHAIVADRHSIVQCVLLHEGCDSLPAVIIHRYTQRRIAAIFVGLLELNKPGYLDLTWAAPSGPEIEQHDLALEVGALDGHTFVVLHIHVGRALPIFI